MEERMIGTPQSGRRTWSTLRVASLVVGVAGLLTTGACGDDGDLNLVPVVVPTNIVTTFKDSSFNFTTLRTFAMPDTVVHFAPIVGAPDPLTRNLDRTILDRTRQDFLARGYVEVTPSASVTPDFVVLCGVTASDNFNAFNTFNWFTIWGFSPIWVFNPNFNDSWIYIYPWFPVTGNVAYPRGTLVISLTPTVSVNPLAQSIQAAWAGVANGLLGIQNNVTVTAAIDEMFRQSPYLTAPTP